MADQSVKKKFYYIYRILMDKTDEEHVLSTSGLIRELEKYDIKAERKGIYNDIELLIDCGVDIQRTEGRGGGYYIGERNFELPEVKLLVDAVQSSKFITARKSELLIGKLKKLVSSHQAVKLQRYVYIYNRAKTENETIYYAVDEIHNAMLENRKIRYKYAYWTPDKKLELRNGGSVYEVSPWALSWEDDNYYLVAYDDSHGTIRHYRVDKMRSVTVSDKERTGRKEFENFDLAEFSKKTFNMYGGDDRQLTLRCDNKMAGVILDRFGTDVMLIPEDPEHFRVRILAAVSAQFYGWLAGLGTSVTIAEPRDVACAYRRYLEEITDIYKGQNAEE